MTISSPFSYVSCHKSTKKDRWLHLRYLLEICVQKHQLRQPMFDLQIIGATFDFIIRIAPTVEIRVLALELQSLFAENDRAL